MDNFLFLILLTISIIILTTIGIYSLRMKRTPGGLPFITGIFLAILWTITYGIDITCPSTEEKLLIMRIRFTIDSLMIGFWVIMIIEHSTRCIWRSKRRLIPFLIIPFITTCIAWTSEYHNFLYYGYYPDTTGPAGGFIIEKSHFIWFFLLYLYCLIIFGWYSILKEKKGVSSLFHRHNLMLFASIFIPSVMDIVFNMEISSVRGYNLTASLFSGTSLFLAWSIFRYGALDIVPIWRSTVLENMTELMMIFDEKDRLVDINKSAITGLSLDIKRIAGTSAFLLLKEWPELMNFYKKNTAHSEIMVGEKFYDIRTMHINNKTGNILGKMIILTDITIRKIMEDKLIESEEYYRKLINTSPDGIIIFNKEGNITFASPKSYELYGLNGNISVTGQSVMRWIHPEYREKAIKRIKQLVENRCNLQPFEYKMLKNDGTVFWGELTSQPILDKSGAVKEILTITRDITERKKMEEKLIKAKEEAEAANYSKSMFLANMSHEIRTPMAGIMGMIDLILTTKLTGEQKDYILTLKNSSEALISIINDILDFSKIEAGKLEFEIIPFNLECIIKGIFDLFSLKCQEKDILFKNTMSPNLPVYLKGDPARLRQILINLLGNAIKFTYHGEVELKIEVLMEEKEKVLLKFHVKDTGIGIPEDKKNLIFNPFTQADISHNRRFGGTGLGLAISKELAEKMGGEIGFYSEKDKGSTFWFTAYLEKSSEELMPEKREIPEIINKSRERYSILLVEDNLTNQKMIKDILGKVGYNVYVAGNGYDALILLSDRKFDLIFMDCQMPEMDGYEATGILRSGEFPDLNRNVPVIAITAGAQREDRERCLLSGMNDYLSKPFKLENLIHTTEKWLNIKGKIETFFQETGTKKYNQKDKSEINSQETVKEKNNHIWNEDIFLEHINNDRNMAKELITFHIQDTKKNISLLKKSIEEKNMDSIAIISHSLKGSASLTGAKGMTFICKEIETMTRNKELNGLNELMAELEKEFELFIKETEIWLNLEK